MIDDNPDIVFTLRVGLDSDPTMQVFDYDNPVTALVEFEPNFYDLLLIDVNMPLLDGFQLARNLVRRDLIQPPQPAQTSCVLFVSEYNQPPNFGIL